MDDNYWQLIAFEYPRFDKPVLVTDGKSHRIYILRLKQKIKFWESMSSNNMTYYPTHWMNLPELPK
jgi:hypothetical protein